MNRKGRKQAKRPTNGQAPIRLWHPEVPGPLWNGTRRVGRNQIERYCRVVAREFRPKKIILFGSYAYGKPTLDSDVDLAVVMPFRGRDIQMMGKIRGQVGAPFPMDLLVWSPARARKTDYFTREVLTRGKVMYEA
ncbi:MAG: nucleotidyltransferase domain-containing protein [Verrucomicrobia bacterium]|nr:nucleotidyltransferase domain-containing protein [Verrucomicrobiota bacterium]